MSYLVPSPKLICQYVIHGLSFLEKCNKQIAYELKDSNHQHIGWFCKEHAERAEQERNKVEEKQRTIKYEHPPDKGRF